MPTNPDVLALIRTAVRWHAPTLFHCGDEEFTLPFQIAKAAALVPAATMILGHMGGYFHVEDAIQAATQWPNLILESCAMPYPKMIKRAVDAIGPERVIFASDGPGCDPRIEVEKIRIAELGSEAEALVFSGNVERILDRVGA